MYVEFGLGFWVLICFGWLWVDLVVCCGYCLLRIRWVLILFVFASWLFCTCSMVCFVATYMFVCFEFEIRVPLLWITVWASFGYYLLVGVS